MRFNMAGVFVALALMASPAAASAQECTSDADCGDGDVCMVPPCAMVSCPPGEECPEIECEEVGECGNQYGIPDEMICDTSADCPAYFECMEREFGCWGNPRTTLTEPGKQDPDGSGSSTDSQGSSGSSGSAGDTPSSDPDTGDEEDPDGESKEDPEESSDLMPMPEEEGGESGDEEDCEPDKISICVFMPTDCDSDDQCDDGFSCQVTEEICMGGSGGVPIEEDCICAQCICEEGDDDCNCPPCDCDNDSFAPEPSEESGDEDPVDPPIEEECEVLAQQCIPQEVPCATDDECPAGWECVEAPVMDTTISVDCPPCACEEGDENCECPDCEEDSFDPVPVETEGMCMPEGWADIGPFYGGGGGGGWDEESSNPTLGGGNGGNSGEGAAAPEDSSDESSGGSSGGCSVAAAGSAGTGLMLMSILFGLLLPGIGRRRKS